MAALPSALPCQASSAWRSEPPFCWMAKSMSVVVPPWAAAMVPVSKSSDETVPPKGMSRWVWASMPPGKTYFPVASMVSSAVPPVMTVRMLDVLDQVAVEVGPAIAIELPRVADLGDEVEVEVGDDELV